MDMSNKNDMHRTEYDKRKDYQEEMDQDLFYARQNLYKLIEMGKDSMEDLQLLAKETEHPRSFEVLHQFMKTLADMNSTLLDNQRKRQVLLSEPTEKNDPRTIDGVVNKTNGYVGTTADLLKAIKDEKKNESD